MSALKIGLINSDRYPEWDTFADGAKNATFLHRRGYMDYHGERFSDCSIVMTEDGAIVAALPAHITGKTAQDLVSHSGLTYGGLLVGQDMTLPRYLEIFDELLAWLKVDAGIRSLRINTSPYIYHSRPADEVLVAMYLLDAPIVRTAALSVLMPGNELHYSERRRRGITKAQRCKLYVKRSEDYAQMWDVLTAVLPVPPVHTLGEIFLLKARFPQNIKLYGCYEGPGGRDMLAGIVVYETPRVARFQYIATSKDGKAWGAGDLLVSYLIETYTNAGKVIDFGTSSDTTGRALERGILDFKEGFGARTVAYGHYLIDVTKYTPGKLKGALK